MAKLVKVTFWPIPYSHTMLATIVLDDERVFTGQYTPDKTPKVWDKAAVESAQTQALINAVEKMTEELTK